MLFFLMNKKPVYALHKIIYIYNTCLCIIQNHLYNILCHFNMTHHTAYLKLNRDKNNASKILLQLLHNVMIYINRLYDKFYTGI